MTVTSRGTSNSGKNGSAAARRARKKWLVETYRADQDIAIVTFDDGETAERPWSDELALVVDPWRLQRVSACRCYRCGCLLSASSLEVDRIVPGATKTAKYPRGGTYVRENIRPVCGGPQGCNIITGNQLRWKNAPPAVHPERFNA